jgi:hypothetical protein
MLCECGCGEDAGVYAPNTWRKRKGRRINLSGKPKKWVFGHWRKAKYCLRGHKRTPESTFPSGSCRLCKLILAAEWRAKELCGQCGKRRRKGKATCMKCWQTQLRYKGIHHEEILKTQAKKRRKYRKLIRIQHKKWRDALKLEVIQIYGGKCACKGCTVTHPDFLTVDHKNNDGAKHRKQMRSGKKVKSLTSFYAWLKKRGFPKDRFQLLCWNCNLSKYQHGSCPHTRGEA